MNKVFLGLGGNLGNRETYLSQAIKQINLEIGTVLNISDIFESEPWGFEHHIPFLNQVIEVETKLEALCVLDKCQQIEKSLGRERFLDGYRPRTIDIDVLFYNDFIYSLPPLIIPHKLLHQRMFVLEPMAQIAPDLVHPLFGISVKELKEACTDTVKVWQYKPKMVGA